MKNLLLILFAFMVFTSCEKSSKQTTDEQPQSVSKKKNTNGRASTARVGGNLFNTSGAAIVGTFEVGRGETEDTLIGTVTNWQGTWWDYHFNWCPPTYSMLPGGTGETNYLLNITLPSPFTYVTIVPHNGETKCYFFGVSSVDATGNPVNVAGKSITVN